MCGIFLLKLTQQRILLLQLLLRKLWLFGSYIFGKELLNADLGNGSVLGKIDILHCAHGTVQCYGEWLVWGHDGDGNVVLVMSSVRTNADEILSSGLGISLEEGAVAFFQACTTDFTTSRP
jgi:hypothetical protein